MSATDPASVTTWVICRGYCPACDRVALVIREAAVTEMRCPHCEAVLQDACGDEQRKVKGTPCLR
jgi:hypothetical protein